MTSKFGELALPQDGGMLHEHDRSHQDSSRRRWSAWRRTAGKTPARTPSPLRARAVRRGTLDPLLLQSHVLAARRNALWGVELAQGRRRCPVRSAAAS
jgi:hypothetical protein